MKKLTLSYKYSLNSAAHYDLPLYYVSRNNYVKVTSMRRKIGDIIRSTRFDLNFYGTYNME